jgi:type I restriction enzyme, S subunit
MPDYAAAFDGTNITFINRNAIKKIETTELGGFPLLDPETYNDARIVDHSLAIGILEAILAAAFRGELTANWRQHRPHRANGKQLLEQLVASREKHSTKKRGGPVEALDQPEGLQALPHGWTWCPVAILASAVSDGVHKKPDYVEQGVPFLTVRNLTAGPGITFDGCRYVTPSDHEEFIKRTHPERGDLLISKDGTLGVVRAIRTDVVFSIFVSVALVKPADRSMTDYLELAFSSPQVQQQMVGVGTGLQHIHLTDLRRDFVPIAPAEERAEIVKRVHNAFAYIERLETETIRAAKLIDRLDQATLAKAFRGDLVPQ